MNHNEPAIRLENISKCYRIFENPQDRLKQALLDRFGIWQKADGDVQLFREHWALNDISFEVAAGEAVGILGRNGAGKSTLLQIIAGTLTPTAGEVSIKGRVTALLELGSGFNPEFTGRENVFHNAQILGLSRKDTEERFDGIAGFADIGDFLDQPVKTYSSGMLMRLAFAVQTSLSPQILIVDEALSVGDMFFQAKCMARINALVDEGVSLLFVSHDLGSIRHLCKRSLLLSEGQSVFFGDVTEATSRYERLYLADYNDRAESLKLHLTVQNSPAISQEDVGASNPVDEQIVHNSLLKVLSDTDKFNSQSNFERLGNGEAVVVNVVMEGVSGPSNIFEYGEKVRLIQKIRFNKNTSAVNASYKIKTIQGLSIVFGDTRMYGEMKRDYAAGKEYLFIWEFELKMGHGSYVVQSTLAHPPNGGADWEFIDMVPISHTFQVLPRKEGMTDGLVSWDTKHQILVL